MLSEQRLKWITWVVASAFFLEMIDATALNTSLNVISQSFNTNPINLKLALTSYLLTLGIVMPLNGFLVEKLSEKRLFLFANVVFFIGSLGCGLSHGISSLVIFRIMQGIGGAFLAPIARMIVIKNYSKDNLHKGFNIIASVISFGLICGPILGGIISTHISWRFIFFINLPITAGVLVFAYYLLPQQAYRRDFPVFDWLGFITLGVSLASVLFILELVKDARLNSWLSYGLLLLCAVSFAIYLRRAIYAKTPLFPRSLWHERQYRFGLLGLFLWRLGSAAIFFLMPLYVQLYHGFSAADAGLFLVSSALGTIAAQPLATKSAKSRHNLERQIFSVIGLTVVLLLSLAWLLAYHALWLTLPLLFLQGACMRIGMVSINLSIYGKIDKSVYTQAVVLNNVAIQLGGSFAISLVAVIILLATGNAWLASATIPISGFQAAFAVMSVFPMLALLAFVRQRKIMRDVTC